MKVLISSLVALLLVCECRTAAEENPLRLLRHENAAIKWDSSIQLTASPSILSKSVTWATVSWSGVQDPSASDWIGLWVLPEKSSDDYSNIVKDHAPVKYQYCSFTGSHYKTGSGQLRFHMVNMRGTFQFNFLRGFYNTPTLAAESNTLAFEEPNEPLQGHLSLTNNYTEMMLMWISKEANAPQVQWGENSRILDKSKNASSTTYSASDMCDSPAIDYGWMDPGMIHKVIMDRLIPGTKYYYRFGNSMGTGGWSSQQVFTSPPIPGPEATARILAYGDLGHGEIDDTKQVLRDEEPSLNTTRRLVEEMEYQDLVLHIGDICYAEGFAATWEEFFDQLGPVMLRLPYMVNPGNHESDSINSSAFYQGHDSGGECIVPYLHRFSMPRKNPNQPWYGFEYGPVSIIMMSTEHDFQTSSLQYYALVELFQAVNRTRTPWLIFSGHRPMYIDSTSTTGSASDQVVAKLLRENIEPLLMKYKVDMALWGHHHSYQRTCSVYQEKCVPGAPVHIVIGMAGQGLSHNVESSKPSIFEVVDDKNYGYTRISTNSSTLVFEYVRDIDGVPGDAITLNRSSK